jgi:hypothetical protein
MSKLAKFSTLTLFMCFMAHDASAHAGAFTYEAVVNNYFVDIGANKAEMLVGDPILFEYNLYPNSDPNKLADFDNVYVQLGDGDNSLFSSFIHRPGDMLTVMTFSFPHPGKYDMSARFQKGTEAMAEVTFPIEVTGQGSGMGQGAVKVGLLAGLIGLAVGYGLSRVKRNPPAGG